MPNLVKIGSVVLEKKMLTDDVRWTTHDDGLQSLAIGHSGDLKSKWVIVRTQDEVIWKFNKYISEHFDLEPILPCKH